MEVCPKKLIKKGTEANLLGHFPVIFVDDEKQCIACGMCEMRCPDMAIVEVNKN